MPEKKDVVQKLNKLNNMEVPKAPKQKSGPKSELSVEKMAKLREKGLKMKEIADIMGCSQSFVSQKLRDYRDLNNELEYYKINRSDILADVQRKCVETLIKGGKLRKAPAGVLASIFKVFYDAERLETGKSTHNIAHAFLDKEQMEILENMAKEWSQHQLEESASQPISDIRQVEG
jgi:predicted transcriptional regulator